MVKKVCLFPLMAAIALLTVASCSLFTDPNQVAKPTFNPPGGTYEGGQAVSIICTTLAVTIYYTLDGS